MDLELITIAHAVDKIKLSILQAFSRIINYRIYTLTIDYYNRGDTPAIRFDERINDIKLQITDSEEELIRIINGHKFDMSVETELHSYLQQHKEKQLSKIIVFDKLINSNNHG